MLLLGVLLLMFAIPPTQAEPVELGPKGSPPPGCIVWHVSESRTTCWLYDDGRVGVPEPPKMTKSEGPGPTDWICFYDQKWPWLQVACFIYDVYDAYKDGGEWGGRVPAFACGLQTEYHDYPPCEHGDGGDGGDGGNGGDGGDACLNGGISLGGGCNPGDGGSGGDGGNGGPGGSGDCGKMPTGEKIHCIAGTGGDGGSDGEDGDDGESNPYIDENWREWIRATDGAADRAMDALDEENPVETAIDNFRDNNPIT